MTDERFTSLGGYDRRHAVPVIVVVSLQASQIVILAVDDALVISMARATACVVALLVMGACALATAQDKNHAHAGVGARAKQADTQGLSLSAFLHAETSSLVCANPRTGACRENGGADDDCCATAGNGDCAPGYTFAGQIHLSQTATTDVDGFYRGMDGTCYEGNTCCVPDVLWPKIAGPSKTCLNPVKIRRRKPQAEGNRFAVLVVFVTLNQDIEVTILFAKIALQITCTSSLAVSMGPNDCRTGRITRHAPILRDREAVVVVVVVAVAVVEAISNNSNMGNSSSSSSSSNRPIMGRQDLQQMCKILSKILSSYFQLLHNSRSFSLKRICLF